VGGVFVNYRTRDGDWAARLTAQELAAQLGPEQVFFASRSIPPGDDFVRSIEQQLVGSGILLAIIGRQWLQVTDRSGTRRRLDDPQDWVRREIRTAFEHNVRIIPVLLDGIPPLQESDLPDDIAGLARRQYLRLDYRDEMDIAALVEEVRRLLPPQPGERWRVRIRDGSGAVLGAGVLLGGEYVLTCAHVVGAAGQVAVELPGLGAVPPAKARLVPDWRVPQHDDQRGDVALLLLERQPTGAVSATLRREALNWDREVHTCGFPPGLEDGVRIRATLADSGGPGGEWVRLNLRMNPRSPGEPRVRAGFSGAGVVDHRTGHVLGIVAGEYPDQTEDRSWMIPVETILSYLPRVAEWVSGDPVQFGRPTQVVPPGRDQDHFVRAFVQWLNRRDTGDCLMIVAGPHIGAMRGIVSQSSRERRSIAAPDTDVPVPGSVDVAVDVAGRTVEDVSRRILDRAGIPRDGTISAAEQVRADAPPMTIVLDGIDHAKQPATLLSEVVKPLAERGSRLALGFWKDDSPCQALARSWDLGSAGSRLTRLTERLGTLDAADRQLAWLRLEIHCPAPVPGEAAVLQTPLQDLRTRAEDPDLESVRRDLDRLEQTVARVLRRTTRAVTQLTEGLDERRNLRRRLDADKAKAIQAGLVEDIDLGALYQRAHGLLGYRPVDLPAAQLAVLAYEQELRRKSRGEG